MASLAVQSNAQTSELVWAGLVHEAFTLDGDEVWTVEDGGRIRHRDANGVWTFQTTPPEVEDSLRRVFFLDDGLVGWAVGQNGWVLETLDGGATWTILRHQDAAFGSGYEDLWDVHYTDGTHGYILGLHGIWRHDGPAGHWPVSKFYNNFGVELDPATLELYALDIHPNGLALACCEPGLIFKRHATNMDRWEQIFDIHDLCVDPPVLSPCANSLVCSVGSSFEMWDVEISRHPTSPLILAVGGIASSCGVVVSSRNNGLSWTVEPHECKCSFTGCTDCDGPPLDTLYEEDLNDPDKVWRWKRFNSLYDVAILADNSAVACGYGGQIIVREVDADPVTAGEQSLWRDRSGYSKYPLTAPTAVNLPQYGVAAKTTGATVGNVYVTSMGGHIRRSGNGGQTWAEDDVIPAQEWRIRDVWFVDDQLGFMVSQYNRIGRTDDSGATWSQDTSGEANGQPYLQSIATDPAGVRGAMPLT